MNLNINNIKKDRIFYSVFFLFIILHLYWIISLRLLPFVDLPFHLAESTILKDLYNPAYCFSDYYSIPTLIKSNIFHMVFCSLNIFPSVEFANKIYYIIYIIIFPLSSLFLISYIKGNKWFSLLSFLFIYNHSVHWGFVGFTMSVPLIIIFNLFLMKYFENPNYKNILVLILLLLLIFSLHFQNAIFCILILTLSYIYNRKKEYLYYLKYLIIIIPVLLIMIYAYTFDTSNSEQHLFPYLITYYKSEYISSILDRLIKLPVMDNFYWIPGPVGAITAVIFFLSVAVPVFIYINKRYKKVYNLFPTDKFSLYLYIFILSSLLCYLFLPHIIPGQNIINERFTVFIMLSLIIYCGYAYKRIELSRVWKIFIIVSVLSHFIIASFYYNDFKNETKNFTPDIFPENSSCKRLSGIIYTMTFKNRPLYIHFPMYYVVWKKGIATGLVDYRFGVIKRNTSFEKLPYYREWIGDTRDYSEEYKNLEYILLKDSIKLNFNGFENIKSADNWYLYENINLIKK